MFTKFGIRGPVLAALMALLAAAAPARTQAREYLSTQHLHEEVRASKSVGALPPGKVLHFDVLLPPGAAQQLDAFLADVYDPASASYHRFVTPAEFAARFGPSQADWDELVSFARQSGFTIVGGSREEMDLRLAAPVHAIEAAFHVTMRLYDHPTEARTFYSPDREPSVDLRAAVWHVSGLDNFSTPRPRVQARAASVTPRTSTGACPGNSYCGSDMRAAYYGGGALSGAGQSLGLVEFYGYDSADLAAYFGNSGQVNKVPVNAVSTDGSSVACIYTKGCDDTEQTLDMTQALGMAPGLAQLNVYVGASDTAILSAMSVPPAGSITGKVDAQLSCSWGWGPADPATDDPLFKKFAAQGQSFFTAAGDSGAYGASTQDVFPADDGNVTVVGGTDLATAGAGGPWSAETAWADGGGGYYAPDNIPIPSWQSAAIAAFNGRSGRTGSTTLRNSPDVAAEANFDFYVCADQVACSSNRYGGTSFAAPMWAGYMALVNQQAALEGQPPVGFVNAALYALGNASGAGYAQAFHDVAAGSNGYPAVSGFDLATGWGSPNGAGLINALVRSSSPGFTMTSGGPVSVAAGAAGKTALTSAVTGGFDSAITLTASGQPNGVTVSFSPASLMGAGSSTVTLQVAATVPAGTYPITLTGASAAVAGTSIPPSSTTVALTVTTPSYSLTAGGSLSIGAGSTGSVSISSAASGGFASAIALSASSPPGGITVGFSPSSLNGSGTSVMTVQVASNVPTGTYPITVTGSSGALVRSTTVNVTVTAPPSFALSASTGNLSLLPGASGTFTLSSVAAGGFAAPVSLSAAGQPGGVVLSFSPALINGAGSSTVKVTVAAGAVAGSYPIVLSGTSGAATKSATVTLTVGAATFSITGAAPALNVLQGAGGAMTLTLAANGALNAPVTLSVSGPPGVAAALSTNSLTPPGSVTLSVAVAANAAAGSYPITVSGVSGSATATGVVTLVVSSPSRPAFAFAVGATALTVTHGTSATFTVQTAVTGTTGPAVVLAVGGLPAGVTLSFSPSTLNGAGVSIVTLTASPTATPGGSTLTLSGTAGSSTESSTVRLTVN
jgi:uncharacterized membrane protein